MRTLRLLSYVAPLVVQQAPAIVTGRYRSNVIFALSFLTAFAALMASAIIFTGERWGYDLALLGAAIVLLMPALFIWGKALIAQIGQDDKKEENVVSDPIMRLLPDLIKTNPTFALLVQNIQDHPVGSTAAATALGYMLSQELMEDSDD